jgi:hypothetical protein
MDETRHAETPAGLDATAPLETVPFDDAPTVPIALTQPVPLKRPKRRSGRRRRPLPRIPLHRAHFVLFGAVVAAVAGATAVAQMAGPVAPVRPSQVPRRQVPVSATPAAVPPSTAAQAPVGGYQQPAAPQSSQAQGPSEAPVAPVPATTARTATAAPSSTRTPTRTATPTPSRSRPSPNPDPDPSTSTAFPLPTAPGPVSTNQTAGGGPTLTTEPPASNGAT